MNIIDKFIVFVKSASESHSWYNGGMKTTPKPSAIFRIEVLPLIPTFGTGERTFSYTSPIDIPTGSIVRVPFGKRNIDGLVTGSAPLRSKPSFPLKPVTQTIAECFITEEQFALALWLSKTYFTPLTHVLRHFLPHRTLSRNKPTDAADETTVTKPVRHRVTHTESVAIKTVLNHTDTRPTQLIAPIIPDREHFFASLITKALAKPHSQILFLVPEILLVPEVVRRFSNLFPKETVVPIHSQMNTSEFFGHWEQIRRGEAQIIVGTRQALFAPFRNLDQVIVNESENDGYKQWDMSPRYEGRDVALHLSFLHSASIVFASGSESVGTLFHTENGSRKKILLPPKPTFHPGTIELVNLRQERYRKNSSPLSAPLVEAIRGALANKETSLLFINRQGMSAFSVCEKCKTVLRCPNCDRALVGDREGHFRCLHCAYRTDIFPKCDHCGNLTFRSVGFGTEKVEREIGRMFPRARVLRVDGNSIRSPKTLAALDETLASGRIDIVVGTQSVLTGPSLPNLSVIGIIDADSLLAFPDWKADDRLLSSLHHSCFRVGSEDEKRRGVVVIQTFHPEHLFFQKISSDPVSDRLRKTLAERKLLGYPPFFRFIRLVCEDTDHTKVEAKANELVNLITPLLPKKSGWRISDPQPPLVPKVRGRFRIQLVLRYPCADTLPKRLNTAILLFGKQNGLIVDPDPISIL